MRGASDGGGPGLDPRVGTDHAPGHRKGDQVGRRAGVHASRPAWARPPDGGAHAQHLWSTYFDSRDLRLYARGVTLRHRQGEDGGPGVWTLSFPAVDERVRMTRTEPTWTGPVDPVPDDALQMLRGILRREPLRVVTELECSRRRVALEDEGGRSLGEVDHDTVTVHGGAHDGLRFHEVEVEADQADDRVRRVLLRLQDAGARPTDAGPELGRAIERQEGGTTSPMLQDPAVGDVLSLGLRSSMGRLLDHDIQLRSDPLHPPPRAVHQARVAARRLRSDLGTLGTLLDPVWLGHVRADLQWLGSALGEVRDCDVLTDRLVAERQLGAADDAGRAVLLATLGRRRDAASQGVAVVIGSERYLALLDRLHAAVSNPPVADPSLRAARAREVLPPLVGAEWRGLRKAVRRAAWRPTDRHLHKVRIRVKRVRYGAELTVPAIGGRARSTARAAKRLQTVLGRHQDAVVAQEWLRHQAVAGPGVVGFAAGQLAAAERQRQLEARAEWTTAWHGLTGARRRRWMAASD